MAEYKKNTFCDEMRKATKEIHTISDALVNAKLALGLQQNQVWADGLLIFYEIFQVLEKNIETQKNCHLERFQFLSDLQRTQAFKDDLDFYLGRDWMKTYAPRESVKKYLNHLHELERNNPTLLMAYIYHLYMGLLSGGIILRKKRQLINKLMPFKQSNNIGDDGDDHQLDGNRVTNFGDNSIYELKKKIKKVMNEIADDCDDNTKKLLIEESKMVFVLNNEVIRTVNGVDAVVLKKILFFLFISVLILIIYFIFN